MATSKQVYITMLISITICLTTSQAEEGNLINLKNGVLCTQGPGVKVVAAEWNVFVHIEAPVGPERLLQNVIDVENRMIELIGHNKLNATDTGGMSYRLKAMKKELGHILENREVGEKGNSSYPSRSKRGALDFVGDAASSLFGIATKSDVRKLIKNINTDRQAINTITHRTNILLSQVKRGFDAINVNRDHINAVEQALNKLKVIQNRISGITAELWTNMVHIWVLVRYQEAVHTLEVAVNNFINTWNRYHQTLAHLETDILTEDVFPYRELFNLEDNIPKEFELVQPLRWYYGNVMVQPVWGTIEFGLAYIATLPLVERGLHQDYHIKTWELPLSSPGHFLKVNSESNHVAFDAVQGDYLLLQGCNGHNPVVCHAPMSIDRTQIPCTVSIIEDHPNEQCQITLSSKEGNGSKVYELETAQHILVTFGENLIEYCPGQSPKHTQLTAGVYMLNDTTCVIAGEHWRVKGIRKLRHEYRFERENLVMPSIHFAKILNETLILEHLKISKWDKLEQIKMVPLAPLSEIPLVRNLDTGRVLTYITMALLGLCVAVWIAQRYSLHLRLFRWCLKHQGNRKASDKAKEASEAVKPPPLGTAPMYPTLPPGFTFGRTKESPDQTQIVSGGIA